jgi:hypothetical protein
MENIFSLPLQPSPYLARSSFAAQLHRSARSSPAELPAQRGPPPSPRVQPLMGGTRLSSRPPRQPTEPGSCSGLAPTRRPYRVPRGPARQGVCPVYLGRRLCLAAPPSPQALTPRAPATIARTLAASSLLLRSDAVLPSLSSSPVVPSRGKGPVGVACSRRRAPLRLGEVTGFASLRPVAVRHLESSPPPREPAFEFVVSSLSSRRDPRGKWGTQAPHPPRAATRRRGPPLATGYRRRPRTRSSGAVGLKSNGSRQP